ncbi:MAG: AMP-binding protein, partial [Clostridia bacterium]
PYVVFDEKPETTIQNLGGYIKYVHVKDSVCKDGVITYKMMGEGNLPINEMMMALSSINYDGYVSLEWVKRWSSDLSDAAIVFPNFIDYMSNYTKKAVVRNHLYDNATCTGKYVWEKDILIDYTFSQVLDQMVEEFPDQYAFRYTQCDYTRTYSQFRDDVDVFARSLISLGVKKGDKVAIWATNVPQWYISFWASVKIGAILVTVNTAYKIHEAEYLLKQSDTHTLIMIDGYRDSN